MLPQCTQYMVDFLDYIAKSMLIVDRVNRDNIRLVVRKQSAFFNKCRKDETYATSSATPSHDIISGNGRGEEVPGERGEVDIVRRQQPSSTSRFFTGLCCCR